MQFTIATITAFLATTCLAAPASAPEASASELLPRADHYVRFYNNWNFDQPLGNFHFDSSTNGKCVDVPDQFKHGASSVRLLGNLKSCTFFA